MKTKSACILLAAAFLTACGEKQSTAESAAAPDPSSALAAVLAAAPSGDPQPIHIARESAKPGDAITVSGRVMGSVSPFVEGRAAFILGDPEVITACSDMPDDHCETPWDTCCDTVEDRKRATATIQVVGEDGRVLKEGIEGVDGIAKLATLTVSGTVAEGSTTDVLVINATAIDTK